MAGSAIRLSDGCVSLWYWDLYHYCTVGSTWTMAGSVYLAIRQICFTVLLGQYKDNGWIWLSSGSLSLLQAVNRQWLLNRSVSMLYCWKYMDNGRICLDGYQMDLFHCCTAGSTWTMVDLSRWLSDGSVSLLYCRVQAVQ